MCVIIVCPKGVDRPSNRILNSARKVNSHGFGFVSDTSYYRSMDFDRFIEELDKVDKNENLIIHMRYATHGSIKKGNCHPFSYKGLYFAHNGVLPIETRKDMTDSEVAFRDYLYPVFNRFGYNSDEFDSVCREVASSSRFAFIYKGEIKLVGSFYNIDGVYYSNIRGLPFYDNRYNVVNM